MTTSQSRARGLGYRPDEADSRDRPFSALKLKKTTLPTAGSLKKHVSNVLNQGSTNSCVSHAWAQALRIGDAIDGNASPELNSRLFLYYNARAYHGDAHEDEGTYLRTCAKGVMSFGRPAESAWPWNVRRINSRPSWAAYRAAFDLKGPRGYYRIDARDLDGIRKAIANNKPVVFGMRVGTAFLDDDGPNIIGLESSFVGGHALCVVGYDANGNFEIVNSWGTAWRDGGFARLTSDRMATATDLWAVDP